MADGIVVSELTLTTVERVVCAHVGDDGSLEPPFVLLDEQEPDPH